MIATVIAVLLWSGGGQAASSPNVPAAELPAAAPQKSALDQARENLENAEQIYAQSCSDRAYGSYDDLCDQISRQVHQYHVDVDRLQREASAKSRKP
jgi:hypothetical protein